MSALKKCDRDPLTEKWPARPPESRDVGVKY